MVRPLLSREVRFLETQFRTVSSRPSVMRRPWGSLVMASKLRAYQGFFSALVSDRRRIDVHPSYAAIAVSGFHIISS